MADSPPQCAAQPIRAAFSPHPPDSPNIGPSRPGSPSAVSAATHVVLYWEYQTFDTDTLTVWHYIIATTYEIENGPYSRGPTTTKLRAIKRRLHSLREVYKGKENIGCLAHVLKKLEDFERSLNPVIAQSMRVGCLYRLRQAAAFAFERNVPMSTAPMSLMLTS